MRQEVRDAVRVAFDFRCGYCGVNETETGSRLTVDHLQPVSQGGSDDDNLIYACSMRNIFKGDYWEMDADRALLHPRRDDLSAHLVESVAHVLIPLTERGRVYITVLHLNRPEQIERRRLGHRERDRDAVLRELLERFAGLEAEIKRLQDRLNR